MQEDEASKTSKKSRRRLSQRRPRLAPYFSLSIRALITAMVSLTILVVGAAVVRTTYRLLSDSKTQDVWAIFFLNTEKSAQEISQKLLANTRTKASGPMTTDPDSVIDLAKASLYTVKANEQLEYQSGPQLDVKSLAAFGIKSRAELTAWNLVMIGKLQYLCLLKKNGYVEAPVGQDEALLLAILPFKDRSNLLNLRLQKDSLAHSSIYIATRQGRLIFSNSAKISPATFQSRKLVQKFIELPVWQGQLEFKAREGDFYGFFLEIPETNLIIFAETPKSIVTEQVQRATRHLLFVVLGFLAGAMVFIYVCLALIFRPIKQVTDLALVVASGNFDAEIIPSSLGELRVLTQAFRSMVTSLKRRDEVIKELNQEQTIKIRLESEMAIAKSIQARLLNQMPLPADAGLQLSAVYRPAQEVAGDWYGYHFSEKLQSTVVAVVDVSGHGAGASLFTAIAASIFEQFCQSYDDRPEVENFFASFNHQLLRFGRDNWLATAQIVVYRRNTRTIEFCNAGHPRPFIGGARENYKLLPQSRSNPLGVGEALQLAKCTVPMKEGQTLVMYTDGLTERRSPSGKVLGSKLLGAALTAARQDSVSILDKALDVAEQHAKGRLQDDDVCVVALRASA